MGLYRRIALASLVAVIAAGPTALAQSAPIRPQVGLPGCADDVAVRASRALISFESRGHPIRAYLYSPGGEPNGAGIVMLHGGTGFEMNSILFDAHAIQLASRGYWVILPAYFDAGSPDQSRRLVNGRAWRQVALDAAEQLAGEPGVLEGQVALWGYSRGATVGADAATSEAGGIRSVVLAAGGGEVDSRTIGPDLSVLMLHARRDEAVPVRSTLRLSEALRAAGAAVEVQELAFDGHQYDLPTWCDVFGRTRAFLETRRGRANAPA